MLEKLEPTMFKYLVICTITMTVWTISPNYGKSKFQHRQSIAFSAHHPAQAYLSKVTHKKQPTFLTHCLKQCKKEPIACAATSGILALALFILILTTQAHQS